MESNNEFDEYVKKAIQQAKEYYNIGYILEADELMASVGHLPAGYTLSYFNKINNEN